MRVIFSEAAKADIRQILRRTQREFGSHQRTKYRALIEDARRRLQRHPDLGHHREGLPEDWRLFHISQQGKPARHFFLYVRDEATPELSVLRVLHDAMDIPAHLPEAPTK